MSIHYLKTRHRPCYDIRDCPGLNYVSPTFDNGPAINSWLNTITNTGTTPVDIELTKKVYFTTDLVIPNSPIGFKGTKNGKFRGSSDFITSGTPIPFTKILVAGSFTGRVLPYTTPIPYGTSSFNYSASGLSLGQFVLLQNFPTSSGGTDFAVVQPDGSRHYPNGSLLIYPGMTVDPANLRQWRRFEPMQVQSADSTHFTVSSPCFCDYSVYYNAADNLQFRQYTPNSFTTFEGISLENITLNADLAFNFKVNFCNLLNSGISMGRTLHGEVIGTFSDAQLTDSAIAFRQSRHIYINCNVSMGSILSDNGAIRCSGGSDFDVQVRTSGHRERFFSCIFDADYDEDGAGFPQVNISNGKITAIDSSSNMGVFISGNPYAGTAVDNVNVDFTGNTVYGLNAVYLKGCKNSQVNMHAPQANFRVDGGQNIQFIGMKGSQFIGGYFDPRNSASLLASSNVNQVSWVPL